MTTATDIQAQLKEAWENAERVAPQEGDTYISFNVTADCTYSVGVARWELTPERYRLLERAKPKAPEWEAVVASYVHSESHLREVYYRAKDGLWESNTRVASDDELVDPVPLVELPSREEILEALEKPYYAQGGWSWPGSYPLADAVLELLRGER